MALCSNGEYGVDEGLIFSYPCRVENGELVIVEGIEFNEFSKNKLELTLTELKEERDSVKSMGLI
jgi:malate dehydrogenase